MASNSFDVARRIRTLRCPRCGYVSFAGLAQCKKCGHRFAPAAPQPEAAAPGGFERSREPEPSAPETSPSEPLAPETASDPDKDWQQEVSNRVDGYRRRRARQRGEPEPSATLDFDFDAPPSPEQDSGDANAGFPPANFSEPPLAEVGFDQQEQEPSSLAAHSIGLPDAAVAPGDVPLRAPPPASPLEIVLEPSHPEPEEELSPSLAEARSVMVAPLSKRFLAGLMDAVVLLLAAGLFALIFWRAGGQWSQTPLDLGVVGFIAGFFILTYFAAFTAFIASTPGLAWMGIEVRSANGRPPSVRDSFWRAIGYLVSLAALMLGFAWALFDSDGLTWHDRMSGTVLVMAKGAGR